MLYFKCYKKSCLKLQQTVLCKKMPFHRLLQIKLASALSISYTAYDNFSKTNLQTAKFKLTFVHKRD